MKYLISAASFGIPYYILWTYFLAPWFENVAARIGAL